MSSGCARGGDVWQVAAGDRTLEARTVVNAAGAWADHVAQLAGAAVLGLQPMRRTIAQVRLTTADVPETLPLTIDIAGTFYFRPEGHERVWLCPHDETPVEPHDAAPEELDVALAIDRFETVTSWRVAAVERKWAGLRTFAPDRLPVIGFDPKVREFLLAGGAGGRRHPDRTRRGASRGGGVAGTRTPSIGSRDRPGAVQP